MYVPRNAFRLTQGSLTHYDTPSLRGSQNKRGFCGACGSPLTGAESDRGIAIHAGSLDDPSWFSSQMDIHLTDAQPWDMLDPNLQKFELYPNP